MRVVWLGLTLLHVILRATCTAALAARPLRVGPSNRLPQPSQQNRGRAATPATHDEAAPAADAPVTLSDSGSNCAADPGQRGVALSATRWWIPRIGATTLACVISHAFVRRPRASLWDAGCTVAAVAAAGSWLKIWSSLAASGRMDSKLSRKIVHCGSAPLFLLVWPFFSSQPAARYFASTVRRLVALRLAALP